MEQTAEVLAVRVDRLERETAALFNKTNAAAVELAGITEKLGNILAALTELKAAVSGIQATPQKRLEAALRSVISAAAAALAGYLIAKFK